MINILLADDHFLLREGMKHLLNSYNDINVVAECDNGTDTIKTINKMQNIINVVIIDITMPGQNTLEIIMQISKEFPLISTIVLTAHAEEVYAIRALKTGASSYLTKNQPPSIIIDAIRKVASGGKYITEKTANILAENINNAPNKALHTALSNREYTVLIMIASGYSLNEIADKLGLSNRTITTYKLRIFKKINLKSIAEIVRYSIENNLI